MRSPAGNDREIATSSTNTSDGFGHLLLERAGPLQHEAVIEIGCGTGSTLVRLAERVARKAGRSASI